MRLFLCCLLVAAVAAVPLTANKKPNPEEEGPWFEGDIMIAPGQQLGTRNGLVDTRYRWPKVGGYVVVPFFVNSGFTADELDVLARAAVEYETASSCVRIQEIKSTAGVSNYVDVRKSTSSCSSYVGMIGGAQRLQLTRSCMIDRYGSTLHEFLHALGFYHMQSTYDRDDWVIIHEQNIQDGREHNFNKYSSNVVTDFGVVYDYDSVMHYSAYAFSKNGQATIEPIHCSDLSCIGQRVGFSPADVQKLDAMYC